MLIFHRVQKVCRTGWSFLEGLLLWSITFTSHMVVWPIAKMKTLISPAKLHYGSGQHLACALCLMGIWRSQGTFIHRDGKERECLGDQPLISASGSPSRLICLYTDKTDICPDNNDHVFQALLCITFFLAPSASEKAFSIHNAAATGPCNSYCHSLFRL